VFDQPFVSAPIEDGESSRAFRLPPRSLPNMNTQQSTNCKSNGPAPALFALEVSQLVPSQSGEWPVRLDGLILTVFILHLSLASSNPNFDNSFASSPRRLRRTTTSHSEESDYLYTSPTFDGGARSKVTRRRKRSLTTRWDNAARPWRRRRYEVDEKTRRRYDVDNCSPHMEKTRTIPLPKVSRCFSPFHLRTGRGLRSVAALVVGDSAPRLGRIAAQQSAVVADPVGRDDAATEGRFCGGTRRRRRRIDRRGVWRCRFRRC
jgi:hypothetical protein